MSSRVDHGAKSMVLLGSKPRISPTAIKADLAATWPEIGRLGFAKKPKKNVLVFSIGDDARISLTLMKARVPWTELEGPCASNTRWPDAANVLRSHRAFLWVNLLFRGKYSPIETSKLLTQVTASVIQTCKSPLGVLWYNANQVVPPALFREYAVQILPVGPPVRIWVDLQIGPSDAGKMSGFTTGLKALGQMEIETENAPKSAAELRTRMEGLVTYLLLKGPVIRDGDTIGEGADEKIRVVYAPSAFGHEGTVMRIDYATEQLAKQEAVTTDTSTT